MKHQLSPEIDSLVINYTDFLSEKRRFTPVHVDEIASKLARFYELSRKIIDWNEDNVLRRGAIERILKRILFPKITGLSEKEINPKDLAEKLTIELIRGGHLPNDKVPRSRVDEAGEAITKYLYFLLSYKTNDVKKKVNHANFVLEIAACELEEILTNPVKELGLIVTMSESLYSRIDVVPSESLSEEEKRLQIYVATCRTLYDLDDTYIIYKLLTNYFDDWKSPSESRLAEISEELPKLWVRLQEKITSPVSKKFVTVADNLDTIYKLIDDIFEEYKEKPDEINSVFAKKKKFKEFVSGAYDKRYKTLKRRLFRLAVFSTLSVFLSNWFTFFIVEVPAAKIFSEKFSMFTAMVDFLVPTAIMFILVLLIRPPRKSNRDKAINAALGVVYHDESYHRYQIKVTQKKATVFGVVMKTIYAYTVLMVFALVAYVFYVAGLPISSVAFDTFTIALTVFAAVTIKNKARELDVDQHISFFDFAMDAFTLPVARVGAYFANKWKEYNIVAILFNFIVETPFAVILDFIQEWSEFLKERRADFR